MKQIIFSALLLIAAGGSYAQATATGNKWSENTANAKSETANGDFSKIAIKMQNRKISFDNLPQMSKSTTVVITNHEGEVVQQAKVNPVDNSVDIRYLEKGTYFVHLKYRNEDKKGFVLNL